MLRARPPLFHFRVPPLHPASPPPPIAGVIRGGYTCAVQAYLTSICKLLTFSGLKCAISLYFAQTLLRNAKLSRGYQNQRNFSLNTRGALKLRRFSSPDLASLKCCAFLRPTPKRAAAPRGWGKGTDNISDYDLALFSPQCHFLRIQVRNS